MQPKEFVEACKRERDALLASYTDPDALTAVARPLSVANLQEEQRQHVVAALDVALTDAFYAILLALDGAASLGGDQQTYRLHDESGALVCSGDGRLETLAHEMLQSAN